MLSLSTPLIRQYKVLFTVNLSVICFGMAIGWMSPEIVKLRGSDSVLSRPITDEEASWIVSASTISNVLANFLAAYLVDRVGRKVTLILSCVPKIIACLIYIFAAEVWMLLLSRALDGISESFVMIVVPLYAAEVADKEIRGALGTIFQFCSSLGILIVLSIGPYISYVNMNTIYLCLAIISAAPTLFISDSPYYLYRKGKHEESKQALTYLRGSEIIAKEELKQYALNNNDSKIDKKQIFKDKIVLKTLAIVVILAFGLQFTGYNAVSYYLQTILDSTKTSLSSEIASVVVGLIQLCASICTPLVVDNFGRKPILIATSIGMSGGMIAIGTFFNLKDNGYPIVGFLNYLPVISLVVIVFCFSSGLGSIYWLIIAELFDGPARSIGVSMALLSSTISMFIITKFFLAFTLAVGPSLTYWIFATNCIVFSVFIYMFVPETKKKSFEEIQRALGRGFNEFRNKDSKI